MAKKKVLIIGGGMSGLVAAIKLAREGASVTLFECNDKIGKKILVTGNGRCNISNAFIEKKNYHSMTKNIFQEIYNQCDLSKTKTFFHSLGIDFIRLDEGKLYPMSLQAKSVVLALLMEAEQQGIKIVYEARIQQVSYGKKYKITLGEQVYYGDYLLLATGGKSYSDSGTRGDGYKIAEAFSHRITKVYPSIVQLRSKHPVKSLKGLKMHVKGRLLVDDKLLREEFGEVLFTDYGLSGPVILQLSTVIEPYLEQNRSLVISLDFFSNQTIEELDEYLRHRLHQFSYRSVQDAFVGFLNQRLIVPLLKESGIMCEKKAGDITKAERRQLVSQLKSYRHEIEGTYLWNQAQVTKGGVDCREIDDKTLESKLQPKLFFSGELVDIDGDCGGYNLQWAISSGYTAATSILEN